VYALRNITINYAENRTRTGAAGAVEAVVVAMCAHVSEALVRAGACEP